MRKLRVPSRLCLVTFLLLGLHASAAPAPGRIEWHRNPARMSVDLDGRPLPLVLADLAAATGWDVWVQPNVARPVTARFAELDTPTALRKLLAGLDFALLPQPNGPSRLYVFERRASDATARVAPFAAKRAAANGRAASERILRLGPTVTESIAEIAARLGGTVVGSIESLRAYRVRFPNAAAATAADRALAGGTSGTRAESNPAITPPDTFVAANAEVIPTQPHAAAATADPNRIVVALLDGAVQPSARMLPFLLPEVSIGGVGAADPTVPTHGTAMAETILDGIAQAQQEAGTIGSRQVMILPINVFGGGENTDAFTLAQGLDEALRRGANVINLSLSSDTDNALIHELVATAAARGVLVVAAAGNHPVSTPTYPAATPGVVSVTAADPGRGIASYANRGSWISAAAPGSNAFQFGSSTWSGTGTSFSSSWVSGWAAAHQAIGGSSTTVTTQDVLQRWSLTH